MQVPTVKQALRYAVADTKGTGILPGLCILKKVIHTVVYHRHVYVK